MHTRPRPLHPSPSRPLPGPAAGLLALALALTLAPLPLAAQYFGQNKVQYEDFDWKVIPTEHLDVHYYTKTSETAEPMARAAERWSVRLAEVFGHTLSERKPVVMYANHPDFQQTNIISGEIGLGTGGVTDANRNRATQPYTGDFHSTAHVVGHELAHVYQYDIAAGAGGVRAMARLPLWLVEGMAEYLSVGRGDPHTAMWMRDAVLRGDIPSVADLSGGRYFPYRYGQALLAYIGGTWGDEAVVRLYRLGLVRGLGPAIVEVTGLTPAQLSEAWARELRATYLPLVQDRDAPETVGAPLLGERAGRGRVNVAPVLSPDGSQVAFISERGLFSMDLYVADVATGRITARLTSSERQPHFDALNFLETAGAWSPDGRLFAYVVVDQGDNELRIADVAEERVVAEVEVPEVNAMADPAWSPDGRYIAFAGGAGGIHDLWLYDRETDRAERLTGGDMFAELQPAWSPDGRTLAFITDRGPASDPAALQFGPMRLAALDLESRGVRLLPSFPGAKHIDPHFTPDGAGLYFVSDRGGVSDVYRLDLRSDRFFQVTRTATGISGITAQSPALSVASGTGRLAFSIFQDNRYTLHTLPADEARGEPVTGTVAMAPAGVLPPVAERGAVASTIGRYLSAPRHGLPPAGGYTVEDYEPDLALDYVGPPAIGVSVDQFGTNIGGTVSFAFRDLLGDRTLGVLAQAQGEVEDLGGQLFYENRENRVNWAVLAGRVPYRSARRFVEPVEGQTSILVRDRVFRTYLNQLGGQLSYPLSKIRRLEAGASYTRYGFDAEEQRYVCDATGRNCERIEDVPLPELEPGAVNLGQATAAFVGDWATLGFTGPISGARYRFEVEPTFGDLDFAATLADYRRYLFRNPFTLAVRGLHYGRWGTDADDDRFLTPLFLGYGALVRGYTRSSFTVDECSGSRGGSGCPEFDRLVGSRIGVTNVELRFPLFGTADFGLIPLAILPTTVGAFLDAGVAWTGSESPVLEFTTRSTDRIPVASAGFFARINVLGYMVVSPWIAHPFQRPEKDWVFGFELAPGW